MINVSQRAYLEHTTPDAIFATLSDPSDMAGMLPRVQKVELLDRDDVNCKARLVIHMSLGGIFGTIRCEGDLTWVESREIRFKVRTPVSVETHWMLSPAVNGADIQATMSLNLAPLLGPMASFVPTQQVADMLSADLEATLNAVTNKIRDNEVRERAAAA